MTGRDAVTGDKTSRLEAALGIFGGGFIRGATKATKAAKAAEEMSEVSKITKGTPKATQGMPNATSPIIKGEYKLKRNVKYNSNGYNYATDELGRIKSAEGNLRLENGKRNNTHQQKAGGKDRQKTDHGGHLIAHIFGGSGLVDNIVPMNGKLVNQGSYRSLERTWKKALESGQEVHVKVDLKYKGDSLRPSEFIVEYKIDGEKTRKRLVNPEGGK